MQRQSHHSERGERPDYSITMWPGQGNSSPEPPMKIRRLQQLFSGAHAYQWARAWPPCHDRGVEAAERDPDHVEDVEPGRRTAPVNGFGIAQQRKEIQHPENHVTNSAHPAAAPIVFPDEVDGGGESSDKSNA